MALKDVFGWTELHSSTFDNWTQSYGRAYQHNAKVPRDHWLTEDEEQAIIRFHHEHPPHGYRRLTYMMLDADVVACSPSTVHRALSSAGLLSRLGHQSGQKGDGFDKTNQADQDWDIDGCQLNIRETFYFCDTILDGYSRMTVHWDIRPVMKEINLETIAKRANDLDPQGKPRIISNNGPQFITRDLESFVRLSNMIRVRSSHYCPQSNSKLERNHRSLKHEFIVLRTRLNREDANGVTGEFVMELNEN